MDNPLRLNNLVIECDIGDMRVSFVDANEVREYDGPMQHFHSAYELQYVKAGEVYLKTNNSRITLKQGQYVIIPPDYFHWTEVSEGTERYSVLFTYSPLLNKNSGFSEYERYTDILHSLAEPAVSCSENVDFFASALYSLQPYPNMLHKLKILMQGLFVYSATGIENNLKKYEKSDKNRGRVRKERPQLRGTIDDIITLRYNEDGLMNKISGMLHMSNRNTARIINELFDCSLSELIVRQRMNCALSFITESNMPLGDIAQRVGYNSYSAFYKAFKKYYGSAPESYRV